MATIAKLPALAGSAASVVAGATALALGLIATFEGNHTQAYLDPVGIPTICMGHTAGVSMGQEATAELCEVLARQDAAIAMGAVLAHARVPLTANELGAYTSFVYNVGERNFVRSTLLRRLNAGDRDGACGELHRWVYAKGKKLRGLVNRRAAEYELCMTPAPEVSA